MDQISGKPSPPESLLSKRKDAIIARSMAALEKQIDIWLENDLKPMKRQAKRAREDTDSGTEDNHHAVVERGNPKAAQKRTKREPTRRFACPFAKHNPAEFKNVKTCCGPGWNDVHRVKEHVYRRHSLKNACNRCFEFFKDPKSLKEHQRTDPPCKVKKDAPTDIISEKEEDLLRTRAKAGSSAEANWQEMYRIIFPADARVPSPCKPHPTCCYHSAPVTNNDIDYDATDSEMIAKAEEQSHFKDLDECKGFVKRELLKAVKPMLIAEVERALQVVEATVVQKATDLAKEVQTRLFRTWQFQSEQASLLETPATPEPEEAVTPKKADPAVPDLSTIIGTLSGDPILPFLLPDGMFDWDGCMYMGLNEISGAECGGTGSVHDSAYFTLEEGGGSLTSGSYYYPS